MMTPVRDSDPGTVLEPPSQAAVAESQPESPALRQSKTRGAASGITTQEWLTGALCLFIDIVSWILIYGGISYLRRDLFFVGPFEFLLVDVIHVAVICQALFMIGGYDRNNDVRALTYTAEHILAIIGAAAVSSLILYSAAAYDASIKPSRGVVLLSFLVFLPCSIVYRRLI